jgi:aryl-alcohol dehydrogenase-like predicted oxidoreductase
MEYRLLGGSGLKVSALSFGTATFGGSNEFFKGFGETEVEEARRLIDICFEASVNLFDTADGY